MCVCVSCTRMQCVWWDRANQNSHLQLGLLPWIYITIHIINGNSRIQKWRYFSISGHILGVYPLTLRESNLAMHNPPFSSMILEGKLIDHCWPMIDLWNAVIFQFASCNRLSKRMPHENLTNPMKFPIHPIISHYIPNKRMMNLTIIAHSSIDNRC